jgi:hypothetical protein
VVLPARAQANIQVVNDAASLAFPDTIDFKAGFQGSGNITSVVLEYGSYQLTCGTVEAKAFPTFTPGKDVQVDWTWEMRQSGSLPPGASVWWRWQVSDSTGAQFTSPTQTVTWLDSTHPWQTITGGEINLHFYEGGTSFAQQLHDAAAQAMVRLSRDVGVSAASPVDFYIYANKNDLQASVLYSPSWAGGQAFAEDNIVIIAISPDQLDWGKSTEAHELTHVLVGHLTFSCLGFIPTWLSEGLAMYGEGGPEAASQAQFDQAKAADQIPSLRSLTGGFSEEADRADLSYTEAYSVVNYLILTYGRDKMTALLLDLRDGQTIDEALHAVYGYDTDSLDAAWRTSIGAATHGGASLATPVSTPTQVPTFVPVGAAPLGVAPATLPPSASETATATPSEAAVATPTLSGSPSTPQTGLGSSKITTIIAIALVCLVVGIILAGLVIFLVVRSQKRSEK